jgi:hypothetical protein
VILFKYEFMKKAAVVLAMAISCLFAPACSNNNDRADKKNVISASDVPPAVKSAFESKYSTATDIIWEDAHEGDVKTYKVKFKANDKFMKAEYKEDGSLIKEDVDK